MSVRLALALALLCTAGCQTLPQSTSLERATPSALRSGRTVWIAGATVSDAHFSDPGGGATQALTLSLKRYLEETGGFASVRALPGAPAPADQVLSFHFEQLHVARRTHPAYFPAAILTLTIYIWVGGPMFVDTAVVEGQLIARDPVGAELGRFRGSARSERNVGAADGPWVAGAADRTAAVKAMVDEYLEFLSTHATEATR